MYRFQSVNTKFYVISTVNDKVGQEVDTRPGKDSIPANSILHSNVAVGHGPVIAEITGATGLYISLKGVADRTKLTWSDEKYFWLVNQTSQGTYVIAPANGADLSWFDEFDVGVGNHVEVRPGRDIKPPQNEWAITPP